MSDMLAARKKHDADAAPLMPVLATLYTAQSFSDKHQMEDVIAALNKTLEVDGAMSTKIERLPQEMKARVDASDLDASDKEDAMRGFEKGYGNSGVVDAYREIHSEEEQWVAATVDLYTFASHHASAIKIKDQKIVIAGADLLVEFNAKFDHSRDLRKKLRENNKRLVALQEAAMQKTGIDKSDLGLK
jgi:23S rRNA G2069 N7-methylase RlmK/C1962 C5-methylase RlmI